MSADIKDEILRLLVSVPEKKFREHEIKNHFDGKLNKDQILKIIKEIVDHDVDLIEFNHAHNSKNFQIKQTGITKDFLDSGGFKGIENQYLKEDEKQQKRERKQDKNLDLNIILSEFKLEAAAYEKKVNRKLVHAGAVIGILSFSISALTSGLFSSNDIQPQQDSPKLTIEDIQLLSKEKDSLIFSLEKKIDSLHAVKITPFASKTN